MAIDWTRVPAMVVCDIEEYIRDNVTGEQLQHLDPMSAFHYWLQWNGLVGYTESILQAGETLGLFRVSR